MQTPSALPGSSDSLCVAVQVEALHAALLLAFKYQMARAVEHLQPLLLARAKEDWRSALAWWQAFHAMPGGAGEDEATTMLALLGRHIKRLWREIHGHPLLRDVTDYSRKELAALKESILRLEDKELLLDLLDLLIDDLE
jgi:hypothetical protein